MISDLGASLLLTILIITSLTIFLSGKWKIYFFYLGSILPACGLLLLIYAFLTENFSVRNIFLNSSSLLPIIYKFAACWASHEGSMLLWYSLLSLTGFFYLASNKYSPKLTELALTIFAFIQLLFCGFIVIAVNPFISLPFNPTEGLGLNPILQDIALVIHPPILYTGTVSLVVPFINSLLIIIKPEERLILLATMQKFTNFALYMLTIGIGFGAWWAYRELGWGGYWFFDPVENISIMPWICSLMLHHFLLLHQRNGRYLMQIILLGVTAFLLVIYGNFVVRSGIISSVHSFAFSPQQGIYIFTICFILTILSIIIILSNRKNLKIWPTKITNSAESGTLLLIIANIIWLISLLILIISLIYPIYCFFLADFEASIDPEFFKKIYLPLHIPLLFLAAVSPLSKMFSNKKKIAIFFVALAISFIVTRAPEFSVISRLFLLGAIYLLLTIIVQLLEYLGCKDESNSKHNYALFCAHAGFAILVLSITLNNVFTKEISFSGKIGKVVTDSGLDIKLNDVKFADGVNYYRQIAEFLVTYNGQIIYLKPENRLYKVEKSLSQEADIYSFLFYDLYAVLSKVDKNGIINARIYYQPYINFIWLSVLLISLGFILSFFNRKKLRMGL